MAMKLDDNVFVTNLDAIASWVRKHSLWPMPFATACWVRPRVSERSTD